MPFVANEEVKNMNKPRYSVSPQILNVICPHFAMIIKQYIQSFFRTFACQSLKITIPIV